MPVTLHLTFFFFGETEKPFIQKSQHRHSSKRDIAAQMFVRGSDYIKRECTMPLAKKGIWS